MATLTILQGDALAMLKTLPDESVHCCVTSPPYWGLRDYGVEGQMGLEKTPEEYVAKMVEVFREVRRVLRKDGTAWVNMGDSYARDPGKGDRAEYLGLHKNIVDSGCHKASQSRTLAGHKPKDLVGIPWRVAFALQGDGWYLRSDIIWSKPNPMPESVTDRPTKAHEYIFLLAKNERYYYDAGAIKERAIAEHIPGNKSHKGLMAYEKGDEKHRTKAGLVAFATKVRTNGKWSTQDEQSSGKRIVDHVKQARANGASHDNPFGSMRNKRTVWEICTHGYPEAHFATFPEDLVKPCVLAGCPPKGVVLDPFAGSGTVGKVAINLGRRAVLIEINPQYVEMIRRRCHTTMGLDLAV